jgi:hypothetical protein
MRLFVYYLEGDPRSWIKHCTRPKKTSYLVDLIQVFLKHWDPTYEEDQIKKDENNENIDEASYAPIEDQHPQDSIEYEVPQSSIEDKVM